MIVDLKYLINKSGDSILEEYSYSDGFLEVIIDVTEIDKKFRLIIKSSDFSFGSFYIDNQEDVYKVCRIEIQELSEMISIQNGIYVPPNSFERVMQESRSKYNLAYGKRASEVKYIFHLTGYDKLVSCLISDTNSIKIEEISKNNG